MNKGLRNVYDNSPKMVKFKQKELIRAIKFVGNQMLKGYSPATVFNQTTTQYGFNIGYEAFKGITNKLSK